MKAMEQAGVRDSSPVQDWSGASVVVTGAGGFIGSHLVERLVELGARVTALSLYDAQGFNGWLDDLAPDVKSSIRIVSGDVCDTECMRALIGEGDVVFHLAALIGIPYSYRAVRSYMNTNAGGTLNVLEAGRTARRVMIISTSEVYGTAIRTPIGEDHPLQAQSPYAASKIAAEKLAESYHKSFDLPVTIVRPFNTYGPRQSARAVIPTILMQGISGKREVVLGDPSTTRDFNYVRDTVEGLVKLAECTAAVGRAVNLGTGSEISIARVVELTAELTGQAMTIRSDPERLRPCASEVRRLCADNTLLKSLTGWAPPDRGIEGLRLTMEWLRRHMDRYQVDRYYL